MCYYVVKYILYMDRTNVHLHNVLTIYVFDTLCLRYVQMNCYQIQHLIHYTDRHDDRFYHGYTTRWKRRSYTQFQIDNSTLS